MENSSMFQGNSINNVESVIITNNTPTNETQECFNTPPQILGINPILNTNAKPICTPEESPLAQPLCLSGFWPLSTAKYKSLRSRKDSGGDVSNFSIVNL